MASVVVVCCRVPGRSATAWLTFVILGGERAEHLLARVDQLDDLALFGRERVVQPPQRVDELLEVGAALGDGAVQPRQVLMSRFKPLHHLGQLVAAVLL